MTTTPHDVLRSAAEHIRHDPRLTLWLAIQRALGERADADLLGADARALLPFGALERQGADACEAIEAALVAVGLPRLPAAPAARPTELAPEGCALCGEVATVRALDAGEAGEAWLAVCTSCHASAPWEASQPLAWPYPSPGLAEQVQLDDSRVAYLDRQLALGEWVTELTTDPGELARLTIADVALRGLRAVVAEKLEAGRRELDAQRAAQKAAQDDAAAAGRAA